MNLKDYLHQEVLIVTRNCKTIQDRITCVERSYYCLEKTGYAYFHDGKSYSNELKDIISIQRIQPMKTLEQVLKQVYIIATTEGDFPANYTAEDVIDDIIREIETHARQVVNEVMNEREKKEQLKAQIKDLQSQLEAKQQELNSL